MKIFDSVEHVLFFTLFVPRIWDEFVVVESLDAIEPHFPGTNVLGQEEQATLIHIQKISFKISNKIAQLSILFFCYLFKNPNFSLRIQTSAYSFSSGGLKSLPRREQCYVSKCKEIRNQSLCHVAYLSVLLFWSLYAWVQYSKMGSRRKGRMETKEKNRRRNKNCGVVGCS